MVNTFQLLQDDVDAAVIEHGLWTIMIFFEDAELPPPVQLKACQGTDMHTGLELVGLCRVSCECASPWLLVEWHTSELYSAHMGS